MDVKVTPKLLIRLMREFCNLIYSHVSRLDANLFYRPCGQGEIRTPEDRSHLIYSQAVLTAAEDCGIEPHPNTRTKQISSLPSSPSELVFHLFAEREGFEPPIPFGMTVFKTVAINLALPPLQNITDIRH